MGEQTWLFQRSWKTHHITSLDVGFPKALCLHVIPDTFDVEIRAKPSLPGLVVLLDAEDSSS